MCEPFRQCGLEQFAAQLIAGEPDDLEHRQEHERIVSAFGPRPPAGRARHKRTMKQAQGALAMITASGAKLVEDARFVEQPGPAIASVDARERLALGGKTPVRCLGTPRL